MSREGQTTERRQQVEPSFSHPHLLPPLRPKRRNIPMLRAPTQQSCRCDRLSRTRSLSSRPAPQDPPTPPHPTIPPPARALPEPSFFAVESENLHPLYSPPEPPSSLRARSEQEEKKVNRVV